MDTARGRSDFGRRRSNIYNRFQVFFSHQVRKYGNRDLNHIFPTLLKLMLGGGALALITTRTPIFGPVIKNYSNDSNTLKFLTKEIGLADFRKDQTKF